MALCLSQNRFLTHQTIHSLYERGETEENLLYELARRKGLPREIVLKLAHHQDSMIWHRVSDQLTKRDNLYFGVRYFVLEARDFLSALRKYGKHFFLPNPSA